jgi:alpha-tubulin suppressor-like RCC1 family protein
MSRAHPAALLGALLWLAGCVQNVQIFELTDAESGVAPPRDAGADTSVPGDAAPATGSARVVSAFEHTCVVEETGLYCWGLNRAAQLGLGTRDPGVVGQPALVEAAGDYIEICTGETHTCGLRSGGVLDCWGGNGDGQLGLGDFEARLAPTSLSGARRFLSVACGGNITCALAEEGALYCWGNNGEGALGQGEGAAVGRASALPVSVPLGQPARQVSVGQGHVCAVLQGGALWCWGRNSNFQLGIAPPPQGQQVHTPAAVTGAGTYQQVSAGQTDTCGVRTDGRLFCWGTDTDFDGRLGLGSTRVDVFEPTQVGAFDDYLEVHASWFHTCARRAQGQLLCWGRNDEGQLGLGDLPRRYEPEPVEPGGPPWEALAVGRFHTCAVRGGAVHCWGENRNFQQLGLGDSERRYVPTWVPVP